MVGSGVAFMGTTLVLLIGGLFQSKQVVVAADTYAGTGCKEINPILLQKIRMMFEKEQKREY